MKIFLIHPVRGIDEDYSKAIDNQVAFLESQGNEVYYPKRDTEQDDPTGLEICRQNREAIYEADIIYIIWDGKSTGSLFDLGMAFAIGKPIRTVTGYFPPATDGKSFPSFVYAWEEDVLFEIQEQEE
jgi:nucleoside 2-deoxyribosyltransferase